MANGNQEERDINEIFDDIANIEQQEFSEGYDEGFASSLPERNWEGYNDGYRRGHEIGSELGYYSAVTEEYLAPHHRSSLSEKALKKLELLQRLIVDFPNFGSKDVDPTENFMTIRLLFKRICALLKINSVYPKPEELSF